MSSFGENAAASHHAPRVNESNGESEATNPTDTPRSDGSYAIMDETLAITTNTESNTESGPNLSSSTQATISSRTDQNDQDRQNSTITTNIQLNRERYISEWTSDEVLGWFQSYKLDELYNLVLSPHETIDGANLDEIFKLKRRNYESYRVRYTNRFPSNNTNLLKDFDRFGQLLDSYFIDKYAHRFDVAFSFPGDIRDRVGKIAEKLCTKINTPDGEQRLFYDKYHQAELARPNLDLYLHAIYRYQTRLIVVFMCGDYGRKEWCGLESRAIRSLMKTYQNDRIMLLSVDGKTIDGVLDIDGYLDISKMNDDNVVNEIYKRLKTLDNPLPSSRGPLNTPTRQITSENVVSKTIGILSNTFHSISPWYIVVALLSYILGTFIGR